VFKAFVASEVIVSTSASIYFKGYSDTGQSPTYPSEKWVETVGTSVTVLENKMAGVTHLSSAKQCVTIAIKNNVDFDWKFYKITAFVAATVLLIVGSWALWSHSIKQILYS
jgi:hypothetical protein